MWFDNDPKTTLAVKIQKAAKYYLEHYGRWPDIVLVNPGVLDESCTGGKVAIFTPPVSETPATAEKKDLTVYATVRTLRSVLPGHMWIGVDEKSPQVMDAIWAKPTEPKLEKPIASPVEDKPYSELEQEIPPLDPDAPADEWVMNTAKLFLAANSRYPTGCFVSLSTRVSFPDNKAELDGHVFPVTQNVTVDHLHVVVFAEKGK